MAYMAIKQCWVHCSFTALIACYDLSFFGLNNLIKFLNLSRIIIITVIDDDIILQYLLAPHTIQAFTDHCRFSYIVGMGMRGMQTSTSLLDSTKSYILHL